MRTHRRSPTHSDFSYTPLAAAVALALAPQVAQATAGPAGCSAGTTICVNSPGDSNPSGGGQFSTYGGEVDLRGALSNCGGGTIRFDLTDVRFNSTGGPFVIKPSLELPGANCIVDGEGLSTDTSSRVTVDGSAANSGTYPYGLPFGITAYGGENVNGLAVTNIGNGPGLSGVTATNNIVSNSITGIDTGNTVDTNRTFNNGTGISTWFSNQLVQNNVVYGNDVGIAVNDASPIIMNNTVGLGPGIVLGNATGIDVTFGAPTISGNTISNNDIGISVDEDSGATIEENLIGTDSSGSSLRANQVGIVLDFAYGTSITSNTVAAPTTGTAIEVDDDSQSVTIDNNNINTNSNGTAMLGGGEGVVVNCSFDISVDDNLITTNGNTAIDFASVNGGQISGNLIGATSIFATTQLGAVSTGISLTQGFCSAGDVKRAGPAHTKFTLSTPTDGIGVFSNTILNASANGILLDNATNTNITSENVITGSGLYGVEILVGTGNQIVENFIYGNGVTLGAGAKNIDLNFHSTGPNPALPNDAGDTDSSPAVPNDGQNYPSNIAVHYAPLANQTRIDFSLDSIPGDYRIDFYENSPPTTVPGGVPMSFANMTVTVPGGPYSYFIGGQHSSISLTATTTTTVQETSEFSPVNNSTLAPNVQVSPSVVNFGGVGLNTTSGPRTVTVRSSGTDTYTISQYGDSTCYGGTICYGGAFTCTSTCGQDGANYAPGAACSFTVSFTPTLLTSYSQTIQICDNAPGTPRNITLLGSGIIPAALTFTPPQFDFGSVAVGHTSPPEVFTVTNPGSTPVDIGVPAATGDYVVGTTTCTNNLNANESCTVGVTFVPTGAGERDGLLSIATGGGTAKVGIHRGARFAPAVSVDTAGPASASASATLTGTGVVAGALVLPDIVDFGAFALGASPLTRTVVLHNTGSANVRLSNISVSGPFTMSNDCPASLVPDQSCTVTLNFTSTELGPFTGSLIVVSDAPGGSGSIMLTANAIGSADPILQVSPTTIGYGSRMIGTSQGTQRVTIKNIGAATANMLPFTFDGPDFTITGNTCGATLAPASTCFADVAFMPLGFGQRKEHLSVNSNASNNPVTVELGGSGCRPFSVTGGASSCTP